MALFVKFLICCAIVVSGQSPQSVSSKAATEKTWDHGVEHFYNFEFITALPDFREAVRSSEPSTRKLEFQYWLSKALWVRMLDEQADINQDFMTGVLEKNVVNPSIVNKNLKAEFITVTRQGIEVCDQRLRVDPQDLDAFYYRAAFKSNLGAYKLLILGSRFDALSEIKQSMQAFKKVLKRDPSKLQALTLLGLGHYMVGTNPWYIRAFNRILGLEGDKAQGLEELKQASNAGSIDAKFILKSALLQEGKAEEALMLLRELSALYTRNISFQIQIAQVLARLGRMNDARKQFEEVLQRIKTDKTVDPRYTLTKINTLAQKVGVNIP